MPFTPRTETVIEEGFVNQTRDNIELLRKELASRQDPRQRKILQAELDSELKKLKSGGDDRRIPLGLESRLSGATPEDRRMPLGMEPSTLPDVPAPPPQFRGSKPPTGFAETPGGAPTGLVREPVLPATAHPPISMLGSPQTMRTLVEGAGTVLGGAAGSLLSPGAGTLAGEALGSMAGSKLSELFHPTPDPNATMLETGVWTLGGGLVARGVIGLGRKLIGKPSVAGLELQKFMESTGQIPPLGAVWNDSAVVNAISAMSKADSVFGKRMEGILERSAGTIDNSVRMSIMDYIRSYGVAKAAFKQTDNVLKQTVNESRVVPIDLKTLDVAKATLKEYRSTGTLGELDNTLVETLTAIDAAVSAGTPIKQFKLSFSESEALRNLLNTQSKALHVRETGGLHPALGPESPSALVRKSATRVSEAIDNTITALEKKGTLPAGHMANLKEARGLWKTWLSGEAIIDELAVPLETGKQMRQHLTSNQLKNALTNLNTRNVKLGYELVDQKMLNGMASFARMLETLEKAGKTSAFQYSVRAGQAMAITASFTGGASPQMMAIALTPTGMARAFSDPAFIKFMLEGAKLAPGSAEAIRAFRRLGVIATKEGYGVTEREI